MTLLLIKEPKKENRFFKLFVHNFKKYSFVFRIMINSKKLSGIFSNTHPI